MSKFKPTKWASLARTIAMVLLAVAAFTLWIVALWSNGPHGLKLGQTGGLLLVPLAITVIAKGFIDWGWFEDW